MKSITVTPFSGRAESLYIRAEISGQREDEQLSGSEKKVDTPASTDFVVEETLVSDGVKGVL